MNEDNMATRKRIDITLHPIELEKLDRIAKKHNETLKHLPNDAYRLKVLPSHTHDDSSTKYTATLTPAIELQP